MYPDDDYEDDLQEELEQDYQDSIAGIRGWDNVEDFYDGTDDESDDDDDGKPRWNYDHILNSDDD